jgi:hypothetical protein
MINLKIYLWSWTFFAYLSHHALVEKTELDVLMFEAKTFAKEQQICLQLTIPDSILIEIEVSIVLVMMSSKL